MLNVGGLWGALDWSEDDTHLLLLKYKSVNESYLYLLDVQTKGLQQLNPSTESIAYSGAK